MEPPPGYRVGWNVRYTTDLTPPVWFYLRGEEYSAQLDHFVQRVGGATSEDMTTFAEAAVTDRVIAGILRDDGAERAGVDDAERALDTATALAPSRRRRHLRWRRAR